MITNDNNDTVSMSSSFSPIYFFCVTAYSGGDFGDFSEDNSVAKRHVITKQINHSNFIIKFGCFHFFKKVATLKMAHLQQTTISVFSNNDVIFRVELLVKKTFVTSQKKGIFLQKTGKKKTKKNEKNEILN